jgi:hypothetical protein
MGNGAQRLARISTATKAPNSATSETDTHRCAALSGPPLAISLQYPDPILRPCTTEPYPTERGHTAADRDSERTAAPRPTTPGGIAPSREVHHDHNRPTPSTFYPPPTRSSWSRVVCAAEATPTARTLTTARGVHQPHTRRLHRFDFAVPVT